jgi:hypothetical protein
MSRMRTGLPQFFDVRGTAPRPLVIHVEHKDINGQPQITLLSGGVVLGWSPTRSIVWVGCCTGSGRGPVSSRSRRPRIEGAGAAGDTELLEILTLRRTTVPHE